MLEVTFQNQIDDWYSLSHYMASQTQEGNAIGKKVFLNLQWRLLGLILILSIFYGSITNSYSTGVIFFCIFFFFSELVIFLSTKFKPVYSYAKQTYLSEVNKFTEKQKRLITLSKKLIANEDYIEISSSFSLRHCKWVCIKKIEISSDFVFLFFDGCSTYIIPKRAFSSEQTFLDFGKGLQDFKYKFDSKNIDFS